MDPLIVHATDKSNATEKSNANLRRDLRRKKILDEAKIRLEKLNGRATSRETDLFDNGTPTVLYSDPEVEPSIPSGRIFLPDAKSSNTCKSNLIIKRKGHIFLASCLGYLLAFYTEGSFFLPFIFCTSLELVFGKYLNRNNMSHNMSFILLSLGTNFGTKIQQFSNILTIIQSILANLAVTVCILCTVSFLLLPFMENIIFLK